jgi:hypothetical protein
MPHCGRVPRAFHQLLVDDQLLIPLVAIERVIALGRCQSADVQIGVGVQDGRVIRAQSPDGVVGLERACAVKDVPFFFGLGISYGIESLLTFSIPRRLYNMMSEYA